MKLTADKKSTNLVKKFLKKKNLLSIPCNFHGFGDCVVRFVSVSESDKYNWKENQYARFINFEIIMKRSGEGYSEDRIPSKYSWRDSRQRFYKNRKYSAQIYINQMLKKTIIPMFMDMASIPMNPFNQEICGNVTYKYID
jgi:hypothetical protein